MSPEPQNGGALEPRSEVPAKKMRRGSAKLSRNQRKSPHLEAAVVESEVACDPVDPIEPREQNGLALAPSPSCDGAITNFPTKTQFGLIIAQADTPEKLVRLRNMVAARNAAARHMMSSIEQMVHFAVLQLRVNRALGQELAQQVRPGPVKKLYAGSTNARSERSSTLPEGVSRNQSSEYQKLSAIPEAVFEEFLGVAVKKNKPPSIKGALKHAAKSTGEAAAKPRKERTTKAELGHPALSAALVDAVQACMRDIDVCIGDAAVKCGRRLRAEMADPKLIQGRVFVSDYQEPGECLSKLAKLRMAGRAEEALVVLPNDTGAAWFKRLAEGGWHCCLPTGGGAVVAYLGPKTRGFVVAFSQVGTVLLGCAGTEPER